LPLAKVPNHYSERFFQAPYKIHLIGSMAL
jgi:hypothetical protein